MTTGIQIKLDLEHKLHCSIARFAVYAAPPLTPVRYSQQIHTQLLNGLRDYTSEDEAKKNLRVLQSMLRVQEKAGLPLNWDRSDILNPIVEQVFYEIWEQEDPLAPPQLGYVFVEGSKYFVSFNSEQPKVTANYQEAAGFLNISDAETIAQRLIATGFKHRDIQVIRMTHQRRMSEVISNVAQVLPAEREVQHATS
jgi:hypothetical protein